MPLPRGLARFNRRVTNRLATPIAERVPPLAVLEHRGRRTGVVHRTPLMAFRRPGGYLIALTYGPETEWVRNVLAAGRCELIRGGRRERALNPRVERGKAWRDELPRPVRLVLAAGKIEEGMLLDRAADEGEGRA